jgi:hypothetical protein
VAPLAKVAVHLAHHRFAAVAYVLRHRVHAHWSALSVWSRAAQQACRNILERLSPGFHPARTTTASSPLRKSATIASSPCNSSGRAADQAGARPDTADPIRAPHRARNCTISNRLASGESARPVPGRTPPRRPTMYFPFSMGASVCATSRDSKCGFGSRVAVGRAMEAHRHGASAVLSGGRDTPALRE